MQLTEQVTSLKLSKRLKELGVKNESLFYWNLYGDGIKIWYELRYFEQHSTPVQYSAFTASDLLEMLPYEIKKENHAYRLFIEKYCDTYVVTYSTYVINVDLQTPSRSLSDALAKMLIYLLENNLI